MRPHHALGICALLCAAALGTFLGAPRADEGSANLNLMVTDCDDNPIDQAFVKVDIYRPGTGIIASDGGFTDEGLLAFRFHGLACEDEARVTLSLGTSQSCDTDHFYVFIEDCADNDDAWTIDNQAGTCPDTWWDSERIQSIYHLGN
jgi:hypothetical protein